MSTMGERIRKAREKKGLFQSQLAERVNVRSAAVISNWEKDINKPDADKLVRLCGALDISASYLLDFHGNSEPPVTGLEFDHIKKYRVLDVHGRRVVDSALELEYDRMTHVAEREQRSLTTCINCYDLAVSAGTGEPWDNTGYKTRLEIPTERVPDHAHYCVRVNGSSMEPAYKDGDIVFVQRLDGPVREGEIGIFCLNGEGYIKRLGERELLSLNPQYPPIPIHSYDTLDCQGRVLGKV